MGSGKSVKASMRAASATDTPSERDGSTSNTVEYLKSAQRKLISCNTIINLPATITFRQVNESLLDVKINNSLKLCLLRLRELANPKWFYIGCKVTTINVTGSWVACTRRRKWRPVKFAQSLSHYFNQLSHRRGAVFSPKYLFDKAKKKQNDIS